MSATTFGWLVLLFPLLGTIVIGLGYKRLPGASAGWLATLAIALAFVARDRRADLAAGRARPATGS